MRSFHTRLLLLSFLLVVAPSLHAQDSVSFVIAPPPLGYPDIEEGKSVEDVGANFLYMKMDTSSLSMAITGVMGFADFQNSLSDSFAVDFATGASILAGDQYSLFAVQAPFSLNLIARLAHSEVVSLFVFGGASCNIGMTSMTYSLGAYGDMYMLTTDLTGTASCGLQASLNAGALTLSPYAVWSRTGGQYDTSVSSSYYSDSYSGSIGASTALVFGFDILHRPTGMTLSSMLKKTSDYQLLSISLRWVTKDSKPSRDKQEEAAQAEAPTQQEAPGQAEQPAQ